MKQMLLVVTFVTVVAFTSGCHALGVVENRALKPSGNPSGAQLHATHCIKCHSVPTGSIFPIIANRPAPPLTDPVRMRLYGREYLTQIICDGGPSVGRSKVMPRWREVFSEEEICRIVDFLLGEEETP